MNASLWPRFLLQFLWESRVMSEVVFGMRLSLYLFRGAYNFLSHQFIPLSSLSFSFPFYFSAGQLVPLRIWSFLSSIFTDPRFLWIYISGNNHYEISFFLQDEKWKAREVPKRSNHLPRAGFYLLFSCWQLWYIIFYKRFIIPEFLFL